MAQFLKTIQLETKKQFELVDISQQVQQAVAESAVQAGTCTVFCPHTTASVRLNQNEPLLLQDFLKALYRLVPMEESYSHDLFELRQNVAANERSNGHAHVKAFLMGSSENLIVSGGSLHLGTKQSLFFVEFDGGRQREIHISIVGQ